MIATNASKRKEGLGLQAVRFIGVFLMGLATGIVLTHVLQMPYKATLPGQTYVAIQNGIYQLYGPVVGAIEGTALLATLAALFLMPTRDVRFYLTLVGALCLVTMIGVWAVFINPINQEIASWTPDAFPTDWARLRDQWASLHAIRAILAGVGLSALIAAVLPERTAGRSVDGEER